MQGESSPTPPDSPSNGVVFKAFITNSLLLIFQKQGLKLCLRSNWEPAAPGPNQSNLQTAFLGGGWSQKQHYCTSRPFSMCATSNYFNFSLSKIVICAVGKMSDINECRGFPWLSLVRKWMLSLSSMTFKEYARHPRQVFEVSFRAYSINKKKTFKREKAIFFFTLLLAPSRFTPPHLSLHTEAYTSLISCAISLDDSAISSHWED